MRRCIGETVKVYEGAGENLGDLLIEAGNFLNNNEGWANVVVGPLIDEPGYSVVVYLHE